MRRNSIKFRIPFNIMLFTTLCMLITGLILWVIAVGDLEKSAMDKNHLISDMVSNQIAQYLEDAASIVVTAGNFSSMSYGDLDHIKSEIFRIYDNFEHFDLIFYMNAEAQMVFSKPGNDNNKNRIYTDRSYYWDVIRDKKPSTISPLLVSSILEMPHFILAAPVFDEEHEIQGLIGAGIPLSNIQRVIDKTQKNFLGKIWILDENGIIAVEPGQNRVSELKHFENAKVQLGSVETDIYTIIKENKPVVCSYDRGDTKFYSAITFVSASNWVVIVEQDEATIFSDLNAFRSKFITVLAGIIIISLFIGLVMARRITSPINRLVGEVRRMTDNLDDYEPVIHPIVMDDEIKELSNVFLEMNLQLKSTLKELDDAFQIKNRLQEYLNNILYSVNNGILVIDREKNITIFNRVAEDITGLNAAEHTSTSFDAFSSEVALDIIPMVEDVLEKGNSYRDIERALHNLNHEQLIISITMSPVLNHNMEIIGAVFLFRDMTEIKLIEEELRHEDRIRTFGELSASIIHDIGNPLAGIHNLLELVRSDTCPVDVREEVFSVLETEVSDLNNMVINFLEFTRSSSFDRTKTDVSKLVDSILKLIRTDITEKQVHVSFSIEPELPEIMVDKRAIKQVLLNLIRNALQAVESGGRIDISGKSTADNLLISIRDNGCGIDAKQIDRLFRPFYTTKRNGTGLGLFIAYNIIREHRGNISISSALDEGAEFVVSIPIAGENQ